MRGSVSVIIVSFNCKNELKSCLRSLQMQCRVVETIIVDNASHDGTREMLESEFKNRIPLKTIYNSSNIGLTYANNQAIPLCSGDYILILNPDTVLQPNAVEMLSSYLDTHLNVGVVGPKIIFENGSFQRSFGFFPTLKFMALNHLLPSYTRLKIPLITQYLLREREVSDGAKDVDWVSAACLMIRKNIALKLGGFDRNIFLSYADSPDICRRVKQAGYQVVYYPKVRVIHKQGKSITDDIRVPVLLWAHQGWLYYFKKYHGITSATILRSILFLSSIEKAITAAFLSLAGFKKYRQILKSHFLAALKIWTISIPNEKTKER